MNEQRLRRFCLTLLGAMVLFGVGIMIGGRVSVESPTIGKIGSVPKSRFTQPLAHVRTRTHRPVLKTPLEKAFDGKLVAEVPSQVTGNSAVLHNSGSQKYVFTFEGMAAFHGQPCPNASILVKVFAGDLSHSAAVVSKADGTYSIDIPVEAIANTPIDWTVEGFTPDSKRIEIMGRRILTKEENNVVVEGHLAFMPTAEYPAVPSQN